MPGPCDVCGADGESLPCICAPTTKVETVTVALPSGAKVKARLITTKPVVNATFRIGEDVVCCCCKTQHSIADRLDEYGELVSNWIPGRVSHCPSCGDEVHVAAD